MNFEKNIDPLKSLDIGRKSIKRNKMQDLLYKDKWGSNDIWMGMGHIICLIEETKDVEYLEIFKEYFLQCFLIPPRRNEKWRWEYLYKIIHLFPRKDILKANKLIGDIAQELENIK